MSDEVLIKVENVSKKFCKDLKTSLWYGAKDLGSEFLGLQSKKELRNKEFWAVKDISFELKRGECLGLIGHNGAGKSTLLKMLNGLIKPDQGKITMRGRIGALIELGAGFNPLLTGRENVYINGQILGFSKKEISQKFDAILEFAELEEFIDTPVRNYSSGMKVRLGFAIAAQMEPDVLIIDEVLGVGDLGFQVKCFNIIQDMSKKCAVILVSHSMPNIARVSNVVFMLNRGHVNYHGNDIDYVINKYLNQFSGEKYSLTGKFTELIDLNIRNISEQTISKNENFFLETFDDMLINFKIKKSQFVEGNFKIVYLFFDQTLRQFAQFSSPCFLMDNAKSEIIDVRLKLKRVNFNSGTYQLGIAFYKIEKEGKHIIFSYHKNVKSLKFHSKNHITNALISLQGIQEFG